MRLIAVRARTEDRCTCPGCAAIPTALIAHGCSVTPAGYYLKTRLTVPQSVLSVFLIVHISVRSRMALKSYAQPAVFFHILMSFTDAAVEPKTRPPHLLPSLEWRKGATNSAHIPLSRLLNDVINELQAPPTMENSCLLGLLSQSVVFFMHDYIVLCENTRLSEFIHIYYII